MSDASLLDSAPYLRRGLEALLSRRCVFFAGLPGTGKSLLVQQLSRLGSEAGREIYLLQWDAARPAFEACDAGRPYPQAAGVTHAVIRRAAGLWARRAVERWYRERGGENALLIGEVPLVGGRLLELAVRQGDGAEGLLASEDCSFVLAAPSPAVRHHIEAERSRSAEAPRHDLEREDAAPPVLRQLWVQVEAAASSLGLPLPPAPDQYDAALYRAVYLHVLRHRHTQVLELDAVLNVRDSVYEGRDAAHELAPQATECDAFIATVERRYPDLSELEREVERWWDV